jgi:RHS repeat-associated protein
MPNQSGGIHADNGQHPCCKRGRGSFFVYGGYGNITSGNTAYLGLIGYAGYVDDGPTQLYLVHDRVYDSVSQRWIQQDPTSFGAGDPDLYRYAGNNPTNEMDPSGLATEADVIQRDFGLSDVRSQSLNANGLSTAFTQSTRQFSDMAQYLSLLPTAIGNASIDTVASTLTFGTVKSVGWFSVDPADQALYNEGIRAL